MLLCGLACGCTSMRLERRTISQGSTLTDLQYDQVLNNLAMFACNPNSLAWHIRLNGGVVQLADQGQGFIGANLGGPGSVAPNIGLQANVVHQWNVDPVIEADDLELLQLAYRKAINPADADGSIRREAYDKIAELSAGYHIALTREVAFDMIETMSQSADSKKMAKLERIKAALEKLYTEIEEISETAQSYEDIEESAHAHHHLTKLEFLKEEIIRLTHETGDEAVEPVGAYYHPGRNVGLVDQAQDKIEALVKLVDDDNGLGEPNPFAMPWICGGSKKDVPRCACLVGHYHGCGCDCYVWVKPENAKTFRDFVLIILSLVPQDAQEALQTPSGVGAANSPSF